MLTYFFHAVFINLYFKTKHSNKTLYLGFYSLSNVFSYRKHIKTIKSRNMKIIAPSPHFIINPTILWYSPIFPEGHFIMTPHFKIFFRNTHSLCIPDELILKVSIPVCILHNNFC